MKAKAKKTTREIRQASQLEGDLAKQRGQVYDEGRRVPLYYVVERAFPRRTVCSGLFN